MAKDPAVLWYFNDWQGGTSTLSRHLKGCYMDILHAHFNNGHLSLDEIKTVLGSDFGQCWPTLQKKFEQDENGLYYNKRLIFEAEKRRNFTVSRRENLKKEKKVSPHMEIDIEILFLPNTWDKVTFYTLLNKWAKNRKKVPNTDLIELRVKELIERYPNWPDAKKAMTEAVGEGWLKFVYDSPSGAQKSPINKIKDERQPAVRDRA